MEMGVDNELVADMELAVSEQPLRERRWAQLMTALYRSGRQADSLRAFRRLQEHLALELGIEPSAELARLEHAILLQDPALLAVGPDADHGSGRRNSIVIPVAYIPTLKQTEPADTQFSLQDGHLTIGRQADNDVVLQADMRVSRHHAMIQERESEWVLRDLRSRNGTLLNGERITDSILRSGDQIEIGDAIFHFIVEEDPMATIAGTRAPDR